MHLSARFEHALLAVESEHDVHCMLEITSPAAPGADTRTPLDLALVIDRSGSMAGRKLDVTKECAAFLARRLAPTDRIALVTYDDQVRLVAPLANPASTLAPAIASIVPGGQTNLSGGWMKGFEVLGAADERGAIRKILLLTDGLANVGVTDAPSLVSLADGAVQSQRVGTTTIGFGDDFDEDLLTAMATGGSAHYAASPDDAPGIFAKEFEDLVSLVAQNVSVEVRGSEHVQVLGVLNEFPCVQVDGGVQTQLGDAYGGETRRVVFELHVPSLPTLGPTTIGEVQIRARVPASHVLHVAPGAHPADDRGSGGRSPERARRPPVGMEVFRGHDHVARRRRCHHRRRHHRWRSSVGGRDPQQMGDGLERGCREQQCEDEKP